MSSVNLYTEVEARRWIGEYEKNERDLGSYTASCRAGRKPYTDLRTKIVDAAVNVGIDRNAFLDTLKVREFDRKKAAIEAGQSGEVAEQREILKDLLGGLPLGDWGVEQIPAARGRPRKNAAPGTEQAGMTVAEAKAILATPKKRGRQPALRVEAERVLAEADRAVADDAGLGASGTRAEAIAEAMGPDEADSLSSLTDGEESNVEDLRPRFKRPGAAYDVATPPNLPPDAA